ncbi:hypothetical protein TKK_0014782 [Trichogramma kaykai]
MRFKFPKDQELQQKWLNAIKRPKFKPKSCHGLCMKHFLPNRIYTESMKGSDDYSEKNVTPKKSDSVMIQTDVLPKYNITDYEHKLRQLNHFIGLDYEHFMTV